MSVTINKDANHDWIGRRIRVRWKGSTYYDGTITSYDRVDRMHTVTYDDGDVRQYNLSSPNTTTNKKFEWIDSASTTNPSPTPTTLLLSSSSSLLQQEKWIGRRLQVQWSQGKWYPGVITNFDASTGKHTVTYDDGDIRQYNLAKKKIDWFNEP
jgi:small nuclear ribonucleoprotein (snRNP)-like protein